jgi:MscS family membrane protein
VTTAAARSPLPIGHVAPLAVDVAAASTPPPRARVADPPLPWQPVRAMSRTISALRSVLALAVGPRSRHLVPGLAVLLLLALPSLAAFAGPPAPGPAPAVVAPPAAEPAPPPDPEAEPGSPLASVRTFLELCRAGDYAEAAGFLELPRNRIEQGPELARRLEAVLDRRLPFDQATLSPAAIGTRGDDLPRNVDEIGTIELEDGTREAVTMVRRFQPEPRWIFARATVARIDVWYAQLENYWLIAHLPPVLLEPGPRGVPWWQWIALPLLALAAGLLGWLVARVGHLVTAQMLSRFDRGLLAQLTWPFAVVWALGIVYVALPLLGLHSGVEGFVYTTLRTSFLVVVFWVLTRLIDLTSSLIMRSSWALAHASAASLVPLGKRIVKVALVAIVVVAVLADLGYPVASMIAGLGIGGLVVALAAQKTVENLFGAFALGTDQPFHQGDYVRIEGTEGTVEAIGLRSTRIRTLDRTLVTVPNGKVADMRIESFAARDRMRLHLMVGLVYETTTAQLRAVAQGFEDVLRAHPKLWTDVVIVRLTAFGPSSLDVEVMAWFLTTDAFEMGLIKHDILIGFLEAVEAAGTAIAYPTQTVHLVGDQATPASEP